MSDILLSINSFIWGNGLVFLLIATGLIFTLRLGFVQFRLPEFMLKGEKTTNSGLSQLRTVCLSLGTTMGTGNIIGTASALAIGGAGAVFWMWVSAFLGMAIVYAENVLSVRFSDESRKGSIAYIEEALGHGTAKAFALFAVLASLGMGGMVQVNTFAVSLAETCNINGAIVFIVVLVVIYAIISGGAERIGRAAQFMLPLASVSYIIICVLVMYIFRREIPSVFGRIISEALDFRSAAGYCVSVGIRRGIFSNEAGLGSSPILHSTAGSSNQQAQGMWSMFEVFFDTLCCTLTAVTLLSCGSMSLPDTLTNILGSYSEPFLTAILGIFALCTIIGWYYCGEASFVYITGGNAFIFCIIYAVISASGTIFSAESVWTLSDIFNGLMAFPNLLALLLMIKEVRNGQD